MAAINLSPAAVKMDGNLWPVLEFLKPYGARCGVEKGTQMGGLLGRKGGCLSRPPI
jgi:hypothetical protein